MRTMDSGLRMFEHVKKFKPASPKNSGFQVHHGMDSRPPTPPVSPALKSHGEHVLRGGMQTVVTSSSILPKFSFSPCQPTCQYQTPRGFPQHDLQPPKKNIFNSTAQGFTNSEHARGEKRKSTSQGCWESEDPPIPVCIRDGREGKTKGGIHEVMSGDESCHGDLQSIIDAIHIIENTIDKSNDNT